MDIAVMNVAITVDFDDGFNVLLFFGPTTAGCYKNKILNRYGIWINFLPGPVQQTVTNTKSNRKILILKLSA